jgi:hypothetical protein
MTVNENANEVDVSIGTLAFYQVGLEISGRRGASVKSGGLSH